jgi:hypothetical protein
MSSKPKADPARALKWTQRGDDWTRLAEAAREDWPRKVCEQFASWSYGMAELWGGVPV